MANLLATTIVCAILAVTAGINAIALIISIH